jgi:MerR family mercuric resistance operon transcriptional regulator
MTIGQLAKAAGVGVETIRYYQRRGLITTPAKPIGGQRHYQDPAMRQIAFIRRAQFLGFTLDEIGALMTIADGTRCAEGRAFAQAKLDELGARIAELNRMRRDLRVLVKRCDGNTRGAPCPFILKLDGATD